MEAGWGRGEGERVRGSCACRVDIFYRIQGSLLHIIHPESVNAQVLLSSTVQLLDTRFLLLH